MASLDEIGKVFERAGSFLVISHVAPDGDTLGSALGLARSLRLAGKRVTLSCADPVPAAYRFLAGSDEFAPRTWTDEDCVVAVDASDEERLGDVYDRQRFARVPLVVIDHHHTNRGYGQINFVVQASSTAELVLELLTHLELSIDPVVATSLLVGLVTDTQGFRTTSTTVDSLRAAVRLLELGADLHGVMAASFRQNTVASLRLWGAALQSIKHEDGIVWTAVTQDMLASNGTGAEAISGLSALLASTNEALVTLVFRQVDAERVEVGFRSLPGVNVALVAQQFGGGGHPQAAGCTVYGRLEQVVDAVLTAVRRAIDEACLDVSHA